MIPFDSSVTPMRPSDLNPELLRQMQELEYQANQPPANRVTSAADVDGDESDDARDCARHGRQDEYSDSYVPSEQTAKPGLYSPSKIKSRFAALNRPGILMPEQPDPAKNSELTESEKEEVRELQERDREVRQHEMTHKALLGTDAGAISYTYQVGPDGQAYAVGGSVEVNVSKGGTPLETLMKANRLRSAALSVGEPSAADMSVGMQAAEMQADAMRQITDNQS